jgi:hypothetical protein
MISRRGERIGQSLPFIRQNQLLACCEAEAGLYHQIDQHRCNIHQRMDDHKVGQ